MNRSSSPVRVNNFFFFALSKLSLGPTQAHIQWVPGAFLPGVKQPGHETDQSPPTSAEVKKTWVYAFTPQYVFVSYCLIS
jgi:hypothetical protein